MTENDIFIVSPPKLPTEDGTMLYHDHLPRPTMESRSRTATIDEMMATVHTRQSTTFTLSTMAVRP